MDTWTLPLVPAVWFGILTSISPCPLATNIAATTFIGRQIRTRYGTLAAGIAYTLGRTLAYMAITTAIVAGLFSIPGIAMFLQEHMNRILGPVLVITGILILDFIPLPLPEIGLVAKLTQRLDCKGISGALLLGFLFAMSFCPISAGLFFGSVIPLALKYQSGVLLPLCYGAGTAAPVIGFALLLAFGTRLASRFLRGITIIERYLRWFTAVIFIGIGVYFILKYLLGVY